jgi:CHAD domain-containing protein
MQTPGTKLGEDLLAMALHDCRAVRQALTRRDDSCDSVHEARKAIRRLRALLALANGSVERLDGFDAQLDRLGDGLSALRDAQVALLAGRHIAERNPAAPWPEVLATLERRRDLLLEQERKRDPGFGRRRRALTRVESGLQALAWSVRKKDIRAALQRSQRRDTRARRAAEAMPLPANLHRWRRRTRRLRMQLEALQALAPNLARELARPSLKKQLRRLQARADALGWYQDLQVLRALVQRMRKLPERPLLLAQLNDAKLLAWLEFCPDRELAQWIRERGAFG